MPVRRHPLRWRALRLVTAAVACAFVVLGIAPPASAHATLVGTDPVDGSVLVASPGSVTFTFDEPVSLPEGGVQAFDSAGDPVPATATTLDAVLSVDVPDVLADGSYVVVWRVVSADGHPVAGSLTFSVGSPSPTVTVPVRADPGSSRAVTLGLDIAQALAYVGLFVVAGLIVFGGWMLPAGLALDRVRRRLRRVVLGATGVAAVAGVTSLGLSACYQLGRDLDGLVGDAWAAVGTTAWVGLALLLLGLLLVQPAARSLSAPHRRDAALALAGVALLVVSPAVTGHTRAATPELAVIVTDVLHVLAGSAWLGGLLGLALSLPSLAGRGTHAAETLVRFSTLASGTLAALVASGSVLAWRIVGSWAALLDTTYGRLLLLKIAVVATAVGVGAWNRWRLLPGLRAASGYDDRVRASRRVVRSVTVEAGLLVAVLALTGFLVHQSPNRTVDAPAGVPSATALLGEHAVTVSLTPGRPGRNTLLVEVDDSQGRAWAGAVPVVGVESHHLDLGAVAVTRVGAGRYTGTVVLPDSGTWHVSVSLRVTRFDNPVATLDLDVGRVPELH